jgi:phosphatidylglycerophosphate synthase
MSTDWLHGRRVARWRGRVSALGSLLDRVADKLLVLTVVIMLLDQGVGLDYARLAPGLLRGRPVSP